MPSPPNPPQALPQASFSLSLCQRQRRRSAPRPPGPRSLHTNTQAPRPERTLFILHGLLGSGRNWRSWARRLLDGAAAAAPAEGGGGPWRALLVDLRCHGSSARRCVWMTAAQTHGTAPKLGRHGVLLGWNGSGMGLEAGCRETGA